MADLAQLEHQKAAMLERVAGWSPERLAFQPAAGEWSTLQVLDHLARTERSISLAAARNFTRLQRRTLRDRLGVLFLARVFRSSRRVKVPPSAAQVLPGSSISLPQVCADWARARVALADLLARAPANAQRLGVFRHPVGGWMTLPQTLAFFSVHMVHHRFQLDRLEKASQGM